MWANLHNSPESAGSRRRMALAPSHSVPPWTGSATAFVASRMDVRGVVSHKGFRLVRGRPPSTAMAVTFRRCGIGRNRIKASLSVFQSRKVKVLGFGVKARLRPQRIASRGCSDPFALVGTIGKACGEAWVCVFLGSPPGCWCVLPLCVGGVGVWVGWRGGLVGVLVVFVCWPSSCVGRVGLLTWLIC